MNCFDPDAVATMRAVLDEAAGELHIAIDASAVRARMAETILRRASSGASREQLKRAALEAGRMPEI